MFLLATAARGQAQVQTCILPDFVGQCDDFVECTIDACDPVLLTCTHTTAPDGATCDDGNACTENESCQGGTCGGGSPIADCVACQQNDDCLDSDPCTDDICDLGVCEHNSGGDGNACDDGDPCTVGDRCTDGTCSGQSMTCDDGIGCTDDFCDGGACVHQPDSDVCVAPNECSEAVCQPGVGADAQGCVATGGMLDQTVCTEDNDPCTDDRCGGGSCVHTPMADPSGCMPLVPSYRLAVSLRAGVDRLINYLGEVDVGGDTSDSLDEDLSDIAADLDAAILVLAGRDGPPQRPLDPALPPHDQHDGAAARAGRAHLAARHSRHRPEVPGRHLARPPQEGPRRPHGQRAASQRAHLARRHENAKKQREESAEDFLGLPALARSHLAAPEGGVS